MTVTPATLGVELQYAAACDGRESESTECVSVREDVDETHRRCASGNRETGPASSVFFARIGSAHARRSNTRGPPPAARYKHHCCSARSPWPSTPVPAPAQRSTRESEAWTASGSIRSPAAGHCSRPHERRGFQQCLRLGPRHGRPPATGSMLLRTARRS